MAERGGGFHRSLFFPVPDRSAQTLIPIIELYVSKDSSLVVSDQWRAYSSLASRGYQHKTVNHSLHFVEPEISTRSYKPRRKIRRKKKTSTK